MILNSGLDAACTSSASNAGQTYQWFCGFLQYAAFGTGSTTPTPADTGLDAQVGARTNNTGGFSNAHAAGLDGVENTIWYEATFTRVFNIASNVNATEWGLSPANTGNLSVRELFRADPTDDQSSPITLTLEDGDELQLVITFRVEAAWEYETKSFTITGTAGNDASGLHTGIATMSSGGNSSTIGIRDALTAAWPGGPYSATGFMVADQTSLMKSQPVPVKDMGTRIPGGRFTAVAAAYTPGDFHRDWVTTFGTSQANGDMFGWVHGHADGLDVPNFTLGYRFILTDPPYLTKASTHRLTLTLRKSIARL